MINENYNKLLQMKLERMAELYLSLSNQKHFNELPFDEQFAILIDAQMEENKARSIELLRRKASIRIPSANLNDISFLPERQIDKILTMKLHECGFIQEKLNVIITGATGAGKTYYVSALANSVIDKGIRVRYIRLPDLIYELNAFRETPKSFRRKMRLYGRIPLLIIDDFLISPLNESQSSDIFELLELRSGSCSTVLASQFETSHWHERLGSGAIADAIMDRIIHDSYIVNIKGDKSMREITSRIRNE